MAWRIDTTGQANFIVCQLVLRMKAFLSHQVIFLAVLHGQYIFSVQPRTKQCLNVNFGSSLFIIKCHMEAATFHDPHVTFNIHITHNFQFANI